MKVVAVILARMGSTRLKEKVLREILGIPILGHVIERTKKFPEVADGCGVTMATPVSAQNDELDYLGDSYGIKVVRGDEDDVLSRLILAVRESGADICYRVTADNPLIDPGVARATWDAFVDSGWDYAVMEDTPLGTTAEIVTLDALERAQKLAKTPRLREHPTLALYENPGKFRMRLVAAPVKWQHPDWRFTVDTETDLALVENIFLELGVDATLDAIVPYLEKHPGLAYSNSSIEQQGWDSLKERKNIIGKS